MLYGGSTITARMPRSISQRDAVFRGGVSHFSTCFLIFDFAEFLTGAHRLRYAFKHSGLSVRVLMRTISPFRNGLSLGMSTKISGPSNSANRGHSRSQGFLSLTMAGSLNSSTSTQSGLPSSSMMSVWSLMIPDLQNSRWIIQC